MDEQYVKMAKIFQALSNPKRVQIFDRLSDGEMCACVLLEHFHIAQPTLSHDMKVLMDVDIVKSRREGQRILYSLNMDKLRLMEFTIEKMMKENHGHS